VQLIPHADVVFLNRHYAQAQSPAYASAPRAFLLALTRLAPPHALLVAYWGADGAAALSVPTREYFQSSGWSAPSTPVADTSTSSISPTTPSALRHLRTHNGVVEAQSVRSGSGFWAAGHDSSHGSSAYSASQLRQLSGRSDLSHSHSAAVSAEVEPHADDSGDDSDGTEIAGGSSNDGSRGRMVLVQRRRKREDNSLGIRVRSRHHSHRRNNPNRNNKTRRRRLSAQRISGLRTRSSLG
jgi:hypothetical protein